jgi:hypothetical protein
VPRFVLWRYGSTPNGRGKYPKIPYNPHKQYTDKKPEGTYKGAATDDPATWGTWADCMATAADWPGWFDGVGLVLLPGDVGIDKDGCYTSANALSDSANELVAAASGRAYIERSVSGNGVHVIVLGHTAAALKTDEIEVYEGGEGRGRYFTLSGNELDGSATPAPAQDLIDATIAAHAPQSRTCAPRTSLRMAETVAMTPELAAAIRDAEARLSDLRHELRSNMTAQLSDLLIHDKLPPQVKDTSASGRRAVVVAQLHRAPKRRYTDAEIYVLSRAIWRSKGYEGAMSGREKQLDADAWRLIANYRPGAPPKSAKRTYHDAPDPLVYLAQLAEEATGAVVLLNRDERAALAGCPRPTAQRAELTLIASGLIELFTYALTGPGSKGRRGALRITPTGQRAIARNESVIFSGTAAPAANDPVTPNAPECGKPSSGPAKNTFVGDGARTRPPHNPRVLPAGWVRHAADFADDGEPEAASYSPIYDLHAGGSPLPWRNPTLMTVRLDAQPLPPATPRRRPQPRQKGQTSFIGRGEVVAARYTKRKRNGALPEPYRPPARMEVAELPETVSPAAEGARPAPTGVSADPPARATAVAEAVLKETNDNTSEMRPIDPAATIVRLKAQRDARQAAGGA